MTATLRQHEEARSKFAEAASALHDSERIVRDGQAAPGECVDAAARAIRSALEGLLIWHGASLPQEAPIADLGKRARQLASMLRTPLQRAESIERLAKDLRGKATVSLGEREAARTSYYTARNLVQTVFAQVPESDRPA